MKRAISLGALSVALIVGASAHAQPSGSAIASPSAGSAMQQQQGGPNVLLWMLDDVGFAQLSSFGGLIATPNIDRVARMGLRYTNYHTTAVCSASRAAMLSGRMPHSIHVGGHAASSRPFPGYDARIPDSAGSIAANLRQAGYATFALGKWDHLPTEEVSPAGPFRQWPIGQGFERFYGFLAADSDNWNPILIRDTSPQAKPAKLHYHLNDDLADKAISMIRTRDGGASARPFFMYWATGTAHAPHHAPREWIERYRGKFDMGWDAAREQILRSQKAQGLIPRSAVLAPRPDGMPAWNSLAPEERQLFARQMEVFAASMSHADAQFGRILDELEVRGELANTIVIITSDNGASAEGARDGIYNEAALVTGDYPNAAENMKFYEKWGGPQTFPHYSFGWAVAGNTPFRYYKQTTHEGGIHVPFVIAWPKGIASRGELRSQFVHVSDVAPTLLEAAGVPLAEVINNVPQTPMEGLSFKYSFSEPKAPDRKRAQYFEMFGNKSLWSEGWTIVTTHRTETWKLASDGPPDEPWELYDLKTDPGQVDNLAARFPDRVSRMDRLFREQAERYNVNPIGNLSEGAEGIYKKALVTFERRNGKWAFTGPVGNIPGMIAPPVTARSFVMTAEIEPDSASATGPIFGYGGQLGGLGFYLREGKPVLILNSLAGETSEIVASEPLPQGKSEIELAVVNGSAGQGTTTPHVTIKIGQKTVASGTFRFAIPRSFGIPETFAVGLDNGSSVLAGAPADVPFPGRLTNVAFDFRPR